jgi:hypothetical protein
MLQRSRVLAGMPVAVFATATFPIVGWANSSSQVQHAAGCHSHLPATPAPAQPSHQCSHKRESVTKRTTSTFTCLAVPQTHLSPIVLQLQPR